MTFRAYCALSLAILVPILSFCQGLLSFGSPWGVMFCGGCVLIDTRGHGHSDTADEVGPLVVTFP